MRRSPTPGALTLVATLACCSCAGGVGCAGPQRADSGRGELSDSSTAVDAGHPDMSRPTVEVASATPSTSATAPSASPASSAPVAAAAVNVSVKIVTIGMHVAGGPFDEPTKEPFKRAVEPHFPAVAQCWGTHVPHPPKQADVGVDLLIEPGGGHPKVTNPRSTLPGGGPKVAAETEGFLPCVIKVFEGVEFAKLDRGRTGVSYSLRLTP